MNTDLCACIGFDDLTTSGKSQPVVSTPVAQNVETNAAQSVSQEDISVPFTGKAMKTRKPRTKKKKKQQKDVEVIDVDAEPSPAEESLQRMF